MHQSVRMLRDLTNASLTGGDRRRLGPGSLSLAGGWRPEAGKWEAELELPAFLVDGCSAQRQTSSVVDPSWPQN